MNTAQIKAYAPKARRDFIEAVTERAGIYGIHGDNAIDEIEYRGDVALIGGQAFTKKEGRLRDKLVNRIKQGSFEQVIRAAAYTWFNRFVAIRYMELHDYLDHGYRVLSNTNGSDIPEILEHAADVNLQGLDKKKAIELRLAGDKDNELYRYLLVAQCNALHKAMPFLFERIDSEAELLLPDNLLHTSSPIHNLVNDIDEDQWNNVEIIGWIYQFYILEKKDEVIGKVVKSEDIPSATQLFTPNWIVKYMVQNTLGRMWMATYPDSSLKDKMEYYIEPADQDPEVTEQLNAITPKELNPEELTFLDPACGSGHILVEAYDLLKEIYLERAYRTRDIPKLILEKNLYGLDIDDRAAQLASFAIMMKARGDDRRILKRDELHLNIMSIRETKVIDKDKIIEIVSQKPGGNEIKESVRILLELFEDGKTFGSLLTVPNELAEKLEDIKSIIDSNESEPYALFGFIDQAQLEQLKPVVTQAQALAKKYDCVVANPPYMGSKGMNNQLKKWVKTNYPDSKSDLFVMFIERNLNFANEFGSVSLITMQSWMFLSSFEKLRATILSQYIITSMAHLGARAFDSISGEVVSTTAFVLKNKALPNYNGKYARLVDGNSESKKITAFLEAIQNPDCGWFHRAKGSDFQLIPGNPIAYWVSEGLKNSFECGKSLREIAIPRQGLATMDNARFTRLWHEVPANNTSIFSKNNGRKWFPYNKGGEYRKWYGNQAVIVNWKDSGEEIKQLSIKRYGSASKRVVNEGSYFLQSITWSKISSSKPSFRLQPSGSIFDVAGMSIFPNENHFPLLLSLLNSKLVLNILRLLSPTLNFEAGQIGSIPVIEPNFLDKKVYHSLISKTKMDWDACETSWEFTSMPLLGGEWVVGKGQEKHEKLSTSKYPLSIKLSGTYEKLRTHWSEMTLEMQQLEEENNRIFIDAYGLQDEITPDVPLNEITLTCNPHYRYSNNKTDEEYETLQLADTMKELISYSVGCMMGRYSLDEPGLIYADSGNEGFDTSKYRSFPADEDGIIPIMDQDWFDYDATKRFVEFISVAWSQDTLDENLKFVAESLKPKSYEEPVDTIRRYFSTGFFKDHMKTYKKRPVYWIFSSGKNKAFECLVYLHRYNESTLSRMRSLYVTPLQGNYSARIEYLRNEKDSATTASAQHKFQREIDLLKKKQVELAAFDDELRHYADMKIPLDLDDGVKVNYGKFGKLLAEKNAITGKK